MILRASPENLRRFEKCHDGVGALWCSELLGEYARQEPGFRLIHANVIEPGASIGEHRHDGEEEIYVILSGEGTMRMDGVDHPVKAGDVCVTRRGHSHGLVNSGSGPMNFLVVGAR